MEHSSCTMMSIDIYGWLGKKRGNFKTRIFFCLSRSYIVLARESKYIQSGLITVFETVHNDTKRTNACFSR